MSSLDDDLFMWAGQYAAGFAQRASYPTIDAGLAAVSKPEKPNAVLSVKPPHDEL